MFKFTVMGLWNGNINDSVTQSDLGDLGMAIGEKRCFTVQMIDWDF